MAVIYCLRFVSSGLITFAECYTNRQLQPRHNYTTFYRFLLRRTNFIYGWALTGQCHKRVLVVVVNHKGNFLINLRITSIHELPVEGVLLVVFTRKLTRIRFLWTKRCIYRS